MVNDTLPISLTRFGDELQRAITRELQTPEPTPPPHRRSRRRRILIAGVAGCAVAGAGAAAVVVSGSGSSSSGSDAQVLRAAAIALPKPAPNTIVHISVTQTMSAMARHDTVNTAAPVVNAEGWFQQGAPYRSVVRETVPGSTAVWQSNSELYDAATKQVYELPSLPGGHPHYTLTKTTDGSYTLRIAGPDRPVQQTVSVAEAQGLRDGADQISWSETWNGHQAALQPMVAPTARSLKASTADQPNDMSLTFAAQLHQLLQSGRARVDGRVTIDDRSAIKIEIPGADGKLWMTYYVDPTTYRPIEYDIYGFGNPNDVTRLVFRTYQLLPVKGNTRLLHLHPAVGTTVDHNATAYFQQMPAPLFW
jgi:hypothetical protein